MLILTGLLAFALVQGTTPRGPATVIDGERLEVASRRVSLWGVRAPETGRECRSDDDVYDCGGQAVDTLSMLVGDRDVRCTPVGPVSGDVVTARCEAAWIECFGTTCSERWRDLSGELIAEGAVVQRRDQTGGFYDEAERTARLGRAGVWNDPDGAGVADVTPP